MLREILTRMAIAVAIMLAIAIPTIVGRERIERTRREWVTRLQAAAPIALALLAVLLVNRSARDRFTSFSFEFGWNVTDLFYDVEGELIVRFQEYASTELTLYFSLVYVYVYTFLLVFPVVAYFALSDTRRLRQLLTAYTLNYALGLVLYTFIVAFGPRNVMPELFAETALYDFRPSYQHLTGEVNHNTNVFPSLHTSLSVTVATFAYLSRREYPYWFPMAVVLAVSVVLSTMYLGIHWATDVAAGFVLAAFSVGVALLTVGRWSLVRSLEPWLPSSRRFRD